MNNTVYIDPPFSDAVEQYAEMLGKPKPQIYQHQA